MVLRQFIYPQEGSQHQGLSGCRSKAAILHKGVCAHENACSRFRNRLEVVIAAEGFLFKILLAFISLLKIGKFTLLPIYVYNSRLYDTVGKQFKIGCAAYKILKMLPLL